MRLAGKVVLVTGSTRGIGKATAIRCAQEGAHVIVNGRDQEGIDEVVREAAEYGTRCLGLRADVRNMHSVQGMMEEISGAFGELNVLVNNAAITRVTSILDLAEEEWLDVIDTNLNGVFRVTKSAIPLMKGKRRYNKIINLSSQAGKSGGILPVHHYAASKAGVIAFTFSLARELAQYGILVNSVAPGVVKTDMVAGQIEEKEKIIPLGVGTVQDVANAIVFLASDEANYVTGEVLDVNGGMLMD